MEGALSRARKSIGCRFVFTRSTHAGVSPSQAHLRFRSPLQRNSTNNEWLRNAAREETTDEAERWVEQTEKAPKRRGKRPRKKERKKEGKKQKKKKKEKRIPGWNRSADQKHRRVERRSKRKGQVDSFTRPPRFRSLPRVGVARMGTVRARCLPPPDPFETPTFLSIAANGPTIPAYHSSLREGPPTDSRVEKLCRPASTSFLIRLLQRSVDQTKESESQADDFRISLFLPLFPTIIRFSFLLSTSFIPLLVFPGIFEFSFHSYFPCFCWWVLFTSVSLLYNLRIFVFNKRNV